MAAIEWEDFHPEFPRTTAEDIAGFERHVGRSLPDDLSEALRSYSGHSPDPARVPYEGGGTVFNTL